MTVTEAVARNRAALHMIKEEPFNAEAPLEGLRTDTTATELHYVRSNFALPDHDGTLQVAGRSRTRSPSPSTTCATCPPRLCGVHRTVAGRRRTGGRGHHAHSSRG